MSIKINIEKQTQELQDEAQKIVGQWLLGKKNNLKQEIESILNKQQKKLIARLMGLDLDYDGCSFKVDHCNGRSGESAAGDWLKAKHSDLIQKYFDDLGKFPKLSLAEKTSIKNSFKEELIRNLNNECRELARKKAKEIMDEIVLNTTTFEQIGDRKLSIEL